MDLSACHNRHTFLSVSGMDVSELRERAAEEAAELGPIPADPREREMWAIERRGAVVLLAGLADWDAALLKRAGLGGASEWTNRAVAD